MGYTKSRGERPQIMALHTARNTYELGPGQVFMETPRAFEIWDKEPLRRVARFPRSSVLVVTKRDHVWQTVGPVDECQGCGVVICLLPGHPSYRMFGGPIDPNDPEKGRGGFVADDPGCQPRT